MFGSLPTGVKANKPWQTLLFRPAKSYFPGGTTHPGSASGGMPADSTGKSVPNPGANTAGLALGPYRFRVVSSKQFVP